MKGRLTVDRYTVYTRLGGTEDGAMLGSGPSAAPRATRNRGAESAVPPSSAGADTDRPQAPGGGAPISRLSVYNWRGPIIQFQLNQYMPRQPPTTDQP